MVKLLAVQELLDEVDLAPLLSEVTFLAQIDNGQCNGTMEDVLENSTVVNVAVCFDLEDVARVVLPLAGVVLSFASGPEYNTMTPLQAACVLGKRTMVKLLL